jgi:hypothetical protein
MFIYFLHPIASASYTCKVILMVICMGYSQLGAAVVSTHTALLAKFGQYFIYFFIFLKSVLFNYQTNSVFLNLEALWDNIVLTR